MDDLPPAPPRRRRRPLDRETFGQRLRDARQGRGWTLARLAERSGVSIPTISRAERGRLALGYENFQALARALDLDLGVLFADARVGARPFRDPVVTRAGQGIAYRGASSTYEFLAAGAAGKRMVPVTGTVNARRFPGAEGDARHAGEEFMFILAGTVEVRFETGETVRLERGDAIYFDSRIGHAYRSVGRRLATVVAVMTAEPDPQAARPAPRARPVPGAA